MFGKDRESGHQQHRQAQRELAGLVQVALQQRNELRRLDAEHDHADDDRDDGKRQHHERVALHALSRSEGQQRQEQQRPELTRRADRERQGPEPLGQFAGVAQDR